MFVSHHQLYLSFASDHLNFLLIHWVQSDYFVMKHWFAELIFVDNENIF